MRCAECDTDNRDTAKFCDKCGARLLLPNCPSYGAENRLDARSCDSCGAALGASAASSVKQTDNPPVRVTETVDPEKLEGERRTVTALLADIKGSSELEPLRTAIHRHLAPHRHSALLGAIIVAFAVRPPSRRHRSELCHVRRCDGAPPPRGPLQHQRR
jgi:Double zinc ribbon